MNSTLRPMQIKMQKADPPEEEIVLQAQSGSHAAYEMLYRTHLGRVYAIRMRMLSDRSKAEEVTQKIFIHAWIKLPTFRGDSRFSSWLYRLSVNMVFDELKQASGKNNPGIEDEQTDLTGMACPEPDPNLRLDLNQAIDSLPRQARIIFIMHDVAGFTHEEIAAAMNLALGTCKAQLSRARRILREVLQ